MNDLERKAWSILFGVFQAIVDIARKTCSDEEKTDKFSQYAATVPEKLGRYDDITAGTMDGTMFVSWRYQGKAIAILQYRWGRESPVVRVYTDGRRTEAIRNRINAALRITNGWMIYSRKTGRRTRWYVVSEYIPFPSSLERLAEYMEKNYITEFSDGVSLPAPISEGAY